MTRFLALGDSYTIGEGVQEDERWPNQLVPLLQREGIQITDLHVIARTAWTTDELADAIDAASPKGPFDVVTLMIGVNDQYRSRPVPAFVEGLDPLIDTSIAFAGGNATRVVMISIPDWGSTPFAEGRDRGRIAAEIQAYNDAARRRAAARGARWVDVTPASRAMLTDPALVSVDGLHPTGAMYLEWAKLIAPAVADALRSHAPEGSAARS